MVRWSRFVVVGLVVAACVVGTVRPEPAAAAVQAPLGVASARDVDGRLVTVTVTRFVSVGVDVSLADAWRQTCPGCRWQRAGTIAYYGRGVPSLTLAADGRLELIAWTSVGAGPPELRVVRETCAGCGFLTAPPADPLDVAAHSEALPVPEPPVQSEDLGVAVGTNPDGRRELFLRGADGDVWHSWEWCAGGCGWSAWEPLGVTGGAVVGAPSVVANADGRLEVFVRLASGGLVHAWQWCGGGCGWSWWEPATGQAGVAGTAPGLGRNADGRLEVFAGIDGVLAHSWQQCPGCGWTSWVPVDGSPPITGPTPWGTVEPAPNVAVATNADGRLEAFFHRPYGQPEHVWQLCAGCWWGPTLALSP